MSIDDHTPLSESGSSQRAMAVHRTALAEPQDAGWPAAAWAEPSAPASTNLSVYLHSLRRHWVAATAIGLFCAAVVGVAVWFGVGPEYRYSAYIHVAPNEDRIVEPDRQTVTQRVYDLFKATQAALVENDFVLLAALRDRKVSALDSIAAEKDKVAFLRDELNIGSDDSELIQVSMAGHDADEITTIVQAVVNAYMEEVVGKDQRRKNDRLEKLRNALRKTKETAEQKRNSLRRLAKQLHTSHTDTLSVAERHALETFNQYQKEEIREQFALRQAQRELEAQIELLDEVKSTEISEYEVEAAARVDPVIRQLRSQLLSEEWNAGYTDDMAINRQSRHAQQFRDDYNRTRQQYEDELQSLREQIRGVKEAEIQDRIRELTVNVKALKDQWEKVAADLAEREVDVEQIGLKSIELEMERMEIENLDQMRSNFATRIETLEVELGADPRIQQLQFATKPEQPENLPIRTTLTVLAMLAGLCLPVVGIVLWDVSAKRINNSTEVTRNLGLTVLGSVPMIPANVIRRLGSPSKKNQSWHLRLTESVDGITARLLRKAALDQTRVILVTSAVGGEGKTTLATQVAMSLARSGRDTLLVDFDLRRPAFDGVFGVPLEPGVSEVLRGETDLEGLNHPTGSSNLSVMTAGRWDRHALAALANGAAGAMFKELRAEHDFIVLDASPILPVADTRFVSQYVDTVVLSVFRDVSQAPKVEAAREILEAFGVESVEAVVTGSPETHGDRDMGYEPRLTA